MLERQSALMAALQREGRDGADGKRRCRIGEVRIQPGSKAFRLPDVDHPTFGIGEAIHPRLIRDGSGRWPVRRHWPRGDWRYHAPSVGGSAGIRLRIGYLDAALSAGDAKTTLVMRSG